jgi:hypothetical protein
VALALELRNRGHHPIIAANNSHRPIVEAEGIDFHAVRPDIGDFGDESELMKKVMDLKSGPEYVIRQLLMPNLRPSYTDLDSACEDADLLVTHPLTLTAPLVAEKRRAQGLAWASVAIAPSVFLSAYDPPVFAAAPWLIHLRVLALASIVGFCRLSQAPLAVGLGRGTNSEWNSNYHPRQLTPFSVGNFPRNWCWHCSRRNWPSRNPTGRRTQL